MCGGGHRQDQRKALNIALNKITGAWDDSLLADLLKDIEDSDFDLGKTGFDPPEIETLFNKVHSKEVKEDDFDVESELKQPCFSKEGDLWHLGKHIVLCGDSTKAECYDTLMKGTKANLVLSDPPYNVDVEETAGKIMNDNMGDSNSTSSFWQHSSRCTVIWQMMVPSIFSTLTPRG